MEVRLGAAAREIRVAAGRTLMDIANTAGVSQSGIGRFEQGHGWRRDTNRIVDAYAHECGVTPEDIWRAALQREE
jgi:transcriptional regulator with XRE-family HTH domain